MNDESQQKWHAAITALTSIAIADHLCRPDTRIVGIISSHPGVSVFLDRSGLHYRCDIHPTHNGHEYVIRKAENTAELPAGIWQAIAPSE